MIVLDVHVVFGHDVRVITRTRSLSKSHMSDASVLIFCHVGPYGGDAVVDTDAPKLVIFWRGRFFVWWAAAAAIVRRKRATKMHFVRKHAQGRRYRRGLSHQTWLSLQLRPLRSVLHGIRTRDCFDVTDKPFGLLQIPFDILDAVPKFPGPATPQPSVTTLVNCDTPRSQRAFAHLVCVAIPLLRSAAQTCAAAAKRARRPHFSPIPTHAA